MRRIILVLFACIVLALTWWHGSPPPGPDASQIEFTPLTLGKTEQPGPAVKLLGAWHIRSAGPYFGGYSSLLALGRHRFLAVSDFGRELRFQDPSLGNPTPQEKWFYRQVAPAKIDADIEALAHDSATGTIWLAYEQANAIERIETKTGTSIRVRPEAMRDWPSNRGPEAMARLPDGRFVVLGEGKENRGQEETVPGLLFAEDPVAGAMPETFAFAPPEGYLPTDMAALPDGKVLIIVRQVHWTLPPYATAKLLLADPDRIAAGEVWSGTPIAELAPPLPTDNFEGLAVEQNDGGTYTLWVISDDNTSELQRTLLLKLGWDPTQRESRASDQGAQRR